MTWSGNHPIHGNRFPFQGLNDEIGNHPAVVQVHPGAIGVEDTGNLDLYFVLAMVIKEEGFSVEA
jgi:hypothetical protein